MSISFFCSCGKRLRAREEMAGRRSMCPRCGSPVGIPMLRPTHRDAPAGVVTLAERLRSGHAFAPPRPEPDSSTKTALPATRAPVGTSPAAGRRLVLENHEPPPSPRKRGAGQSSAKPQRGDAELPPRAWLLPVVLGLLMTGFSAAAISLLPSMLDDKLATRQFSIALAAFLCALVIPGCVCGFLSAVLASAVGRGEDLPMPGVRLLFFGLRSLVTWTACFMTGPVYFAAATFYYWLYCGDPDVLDFIILGELSLVTVGYGFMQLGCVAERGSWLDANPVQVAALMQRLGRRSAIAVAAATALVAAHAWFMLQAAETIHVDAWAGTWRLGLCWISLLALALVLFHRFGICCRRCQRV